MSNAFLRSIGDSYKEFIATKCLPIEELDCFFREITHVPTGAQIIHIENKDPENLFCLSFRTLPKNSNGAAHILEHTVLCGSKKFPIKDPFFSMTRRSLHTFMNALTGSDFTCYPAASQVESDFYHLLDVYLDAVFYPQLKKTSFLQEGCRLEFEDPNDPSSPLQFKGVVYNEMKGCLASGDTRLWHAVLEELFPNLPYAYNSGGTPSEIPTLSYEELLQFHRTYYHPSRCLFFFYGNLPLKNHLDYILQHSLSGVLPASPIPLLPRQPRKEIPTSKILPYAVSRDEPTQEKHMVAFGWLTCPASDQEEVLALSVLDSVLMDTDASPLKAALLGSGLCTQADAFIDAEMSEVPYLLICKGCKEDDIDRLEDLLFQTLTSLSEHPIPPHLIEAAIHQLELARTEISGDHSPFGLTLFFRAALAKQQGCQPEKILNIHSVFSSLIQKTQDPLYLPSLIRTYWLENVHRTKVIMTPDPDLPRKEQEEEEKKLNAIRKDLSDHEIDLLLDQARELSEVQKQMEEQNIDCLPKVTLQDVPVLTRDFPLQTQKKMELQHFHHDCFTNAILYADLSFDLPFLREEDIPYLHLLLSLIPELGAGSRGYKENLEYILAHTGGISLSSPLHIQAPNPSKLKPSISIRGKALARKADFLFPLFEEMLCKPLLKDPKRIEDLIKQLHTSFQNRVTKHALRYATSLALSGYNTACHFHNLTAGIPYYHFIKHLAQNTPKQLHSLIDKLCHLHEQLFSFHNLHLILSCDQPLYQSLVEKDLLQFPSLTKKPSNPWHPEFHLLQTPSQARIIPSQVAYNVRSYPVASYIHPHAPALTVATQLLENKVLHNRIREIGGAYGSGASYNPFTGSFYFYSYRDPHIASTFAAFDEAILRIAEGNFSSQDLEEAKLGIIQSSDAPISPGSRAQVAYGWLREEKEQKLRQTYRDRLLELDRKHIELALQAELLAKESKATNISFSNHDLLTKENELLNKTGKELPLFPL